MCAVELLVNEWEVRWSSAPFEAGGAPGTRIINLRYAGSKQLPAGPGLKF